MSRGTDSKGIADHLNEGNGLDGLSSALRGAVFRRGPFERPEPDTGVALRVGSESRFGIGSHAATRSGGARPG